MLCGVVIVAVESTNREIYKQSQVVLKHIAENRPPSSRTRRIGFSGAPGAGKSTFIEALGTHLTKQGTKLAVLVRLSNYVLVEVNYIPMCATHIHMLGPHARV